MSERKPFKPLDEHLDDVAERVAAAKNIPTLTPPARSLEEGAAPIALSSDRPSPRPRSAADAAHQDPVPPKPAPQVGVVTQIRFRCPNDVSDQLVFEQHRLRREGQREGHAQLLHPPGAPEGRLQGGGGGPD